MIKTYIWDADAQCARDGAVNVSENWPDGLELQKNWQIYEELQRLRSEIALLKQNSDDNFQTGSKIAKALIEARSEIFLRDRCIAWLQRVQCERCENQPIAIPAEFAAIIGGKADSAIDKADETGDLLEMLRARMDDKGETL